MDELKKLLVRVESALGPNYDLECEIEKALAPGRLDLKANGYSLITPCYTSSLDATVGLIEKRFPEWAWSVSRIEGVPSRAPTPDCDAEIWLASVKAKAGIGKVIGIHDERFRGGAKTPALALLMALLKGEIARSSTLPTPSPNATD